MRPIAGSRVQVTAAGADLRIVIRARRSGVWVLGRILSMGFLIVIGGFASMTVSENYSSSTELQRLVLIVISAVPWVLVVLHFVDTDFQLFGEERWSLRLGVLCIQIALGIRIRSREYPLTQVRRFRLLEKLIRRKAGTRIYRRLEFEHDGIRVATRYNLSRVDGESLYHLVAPLTASALPLMERVSDESPDLAPNW